MNSKENAGYLPALTGLRFVAALMVFVYHYAPDFLPVENGRCLILSKIFDEFYMGVGIFFVLSGFIITYKYYEDSVFERRYILNFVLRRVVRIFPLYFVLISCYYAFIFYKGETVSNVELFLNFTILKGYSSVYWSSGITQAWSLATEENFYLLAPVIFYFIRKNIAYYKQIILFLIFGLLLFFYFRTFPLWGLFGDIKTLFFNTFFGRCFEFFVGIFIAIRIRRKNYVTENPKVSKKKSLLKFTYIGILATIICVFLQIVIKNNLSTQPLYWIFVNNYIVPIGVGCLLYGLITEKTIIRHFLEYRMMLVLGYASYAFYLIHAGLIANYFNNIFEHNILILFIFLITTSIILYYSVEQPIKRYLTKKLRLQIFFYG